MTRQGILDSFDHIAGHEDVNRNSHLVQASEDVERMVVQPGEWPGCKQQVDDDAVRHRVRGWHVADVSKGCPPFR